MLSGSSLIGRTSRGLTLKTQKVTEAEGCQLVSEVGGCLLRLNHQSLLHSGLFTYSLGGAKKRLRSRGDRFEHLVALVAAEPLFVLLACKSSG